MVKSSLIPEKCNDLLGHPTRVQMTNGDLTEYVYAADGRKLREKHTTAVESLIVGYGRALNNGWDQFNSKLTDVKSFKLILKRK